MISAPTTSVVSGVAAVNTGGEWVAVHEVQVVCAAVAMAPNPTVLGWIPVSPEMTQGVPSHQPVTALETVKKIWVAVAWLLGPSVPRPSADRP